jgi:hypothetical protein
MMRLLNIKRPITIRPQRSSSAHKAEKTYDSIGRENEQKLIDTMQSLLIDQSKLKPNTSFQQYGTGISEFKRKKREERQASTFAI